MGPRPGNFFRVRIGRKSVAIAIKPKQAAAQIVGTAFRNVLRNQPRHLAEFRIVIRCGHFHFLDRVLGWNNDLHTRGAEFHISDAVDLELVRSPKLAVGHRRGS